MKQQTGVDWFFNELQRMQYFIGNDMLEAYKQAKEMEKQQIIDTYCECWINDSNVPYRTKVLLHRAEQYYNETFKQQKL